MPTSCTFRAAWRRVRLGALSVDHLETMDAAAIGALAGSDTIGTLLPTAAFFLRMPFQPARELLDAGLRHRPGFRLQSRVFAQREYEPGRGHELYPGMRLLPEEAINAATINGAYAMSLGDELGSITPGKRANLIITRPVHRWPIFPMHSART
jgi:imidazolonepropionase